MRGREPEHREESERTTERDEGRLLSIAAGTTDPDKVEMNESREREGARERERGSEGERAREREGGGLEYKQIRLE